MHNNGISDRILSVFELATIMISLLCLSLNCSHASNYYLHTYHIHMQDVSFYSPQANGQFYPSIIVCFPNDAITRAL